MILVGMVELVESMVSLEHNRDLSLSLSLFMCSICACCILYTRDFILHGLFETGMFLLVHVIHMAQVFLVLSLVDLSGTSKLAINVLNPLG